MSRRIRPVPAYHQSVAVLPQTPEVWAALDALVRYVKARPEEADLLGDSKARVVYTEDPTHPGLRLYYAVDETTIYLLRVEEWDELLGDD